MPFDLLSIDVGGEPAMPADSGVPVKPIGQFLARLATLEAELRPGARIAVVGGGAGGTELALALARRYRDRARIVLVCDTAEPLADAPSFARSVARTALVDAGVELACGGSGWRLGEWQVGAVRRQLSGSRNRALGDRRGRIRRSSPPQGLACDEVGCIRVNATLRSISHGFVFAAGDCATIEAQRATEIRRLGGARRRAAGRRTCVAPPAAERCERWRPQSRALAIVGLGDGRAVAWRNGIAVSGWAVWRWKDWIDRRWMRMYQEPMAPMQGDDPMRCGGCGAKVGAEVLAGALADLPRLPAAGVLIGLDAADDAAVMLPPPGMAVVQSVDHFRAFIDDPFVFGEIAAAHALSDLHAMGAQPWTALAVAAVPLHLGR